VCVCVCVVCVCVCVCVCACVCVCVCVCTIQKCVHILGTDPAGTILSPSLVLPSGPSCGPISKQLAALNLLSCLNTLASCSEMSLDMVLLPSGAKPNPDDFSMVNRFGSK